MVMRSMIKLTYRSIRTFLGRYLALLLIVTLGVGFFSGLKITKDAMANACENFLTEQSFYDFQCYSTLGFTQSDVSALSSLSFVQEAEGFQTFDALVEYQTDNHMQQGSKPFHFLTLPERVSLPSLTAGRMPKAADECLADDEIFTEKDIGSQIEITSVSNGEISEQLCNTTYTIVGLADSPMYIGLERGSTNIGNGTLEGYFYLLPSAFKSEVFTEIQLTLTEDAPIYSDQYDDLIESHEDEVFDTCQELATVRYNELLLQTGLPQEMAEQSGLSQPQTYVLTRNENSGYVSFENDTSIVSGIANIFPVFFILIAMLVCITTMTRMVEEERTQIGVLKALGFRDGTITAKYLLYAGSASVIGWLAGYFLGTWILPKIFWMAYQPLYDFSSLPYYASFPLAILTLVVSLIGILVSTWLSCRKELGSMPANLLRPRAAKNGKRICLERVTPLWKRLSFLQKITLRNMVRYKQRLVMMLVGIGCCAGLVVTGFGVRDSMLDTTVMQYDMVQTYDAEVSFAAGTQEQIAEPLSNIDDVEDTLFCSVKRLNVSNGNNSFTAGVYSFADTGSVGNFWDFHTGEKTISFPGTGEAIVGKKVAQKLSLQVGDSVTLKDPSVGELTVKVSGIFDNYIDNFVMISADTYQTGFGEWQSNTALLHLQGTADDMEKTAETLTGINGITGVLQLSVTRENIDSVMSCMNYVIWMVILFSGALAFIVIFNLTNINLAERSREIATVEVLGFYPKETESYVLRENLVLSIIASLIGLPIGVLFHYVVMQMIQIDLISFPTFIAPLSFLYAFLCTLFFAVLVNLFMRRRIVNVHMAESLKAVE